MAPAALAGPGRVELLYDRFPGVATGAARLAIDPSGPMWIGATNGLLVYDGARLERVSPRELRGPVDGIGLTPAGPVVYDAAGSVWRLRDGQVEQVALPTGSTTVRGVTWHAGRLWVLLPEGLWVLEGDTWSAPWSGLPELGRLQQVDGRLYGFGANEVWDLSDDEPARVVEVNKPRAIARPAGGGLVVLDVFGATWWYNDGLIDVLPAPRNGTGRDMLARGDTVWVAMGWGLYAMRDRRITEVIDSFDGLSGSGQLEVDQDGGLWTGTEKGPVLIRAPEVHWWQLEDGVPSEQARGASMVGEDLYLHTWAGMARLRSGSDHLEPVAPDPLWVFRSRICVDGDGVAHTQSSGGRSELQALLSVRDGQLRLRRRWGGGTGEGCVSDSQGHVWLFQEDGLVRVRGDGEPVLFGGAVPARGMAATLDAADHLWIAQDNGEVCHHALPTAPQPLRWICEVVDPGRTLTSIWAEDGELWVASRGAGVLRRTESGWRPIPGSMEDDDAFVFHLDPSPRGGVWVTSSTGVQRVVPEVSERGWRVVERLGSRHGIATAGPRAVLEDAQGRLVVATWQGYALVPPSLRDLPPAPPRPRVVDLRAGLEVSRSGSLRVPEGVPITASLTAFTLGDPRSAWYRFRLSPGAPWSVPGDTPAFVLVGLAPGTHQVSVQATTDGERWVDAPEVQVEVIPPWYRTWWATAGMFAAIGMVLLAAHRLRMASLRALQRQRERIAADLHDEVGSGLAAIAMLASAGGLVEADGRAGLLDQIAARSREVGQDVRDVVWCLRGDSANLSALMRMLGQRGRQLLPSLQVEVPELPEVPLPLEVLRNVQLIALEALHNAVRHARGDAVRLSLRPQGAGWCLEISDNGVGGAAPSDGLALRSMRERAATIGADLHIESPAGMGTHVRLVFHS